MVRPLRRGILFAWLACALLLAAAPSTVAWHWEDEVENELFNTHAGDPRTPDDAQECLNETRSMEGVSCVAIYPHLLFNDHGGYPLNAQRPADCAPERAQGTSSPVDVYEYWRFNEARFWSSPGLVQYGEPGDDGMCGEDVFMEPHSELSLNLTLAKDINITGYWYLSSDQLEQSGLGIGTGPEGEPSAGLMPCLTVRMTMETDWWPGEGRVLAQGETTKTLLSTPQAVGDHPLGIDDPCPGAEGEITAETVNEFRVDLGQADATIQSHEAYHVHVLWYQWEGTEPVPVSQVAQGDWSLRAGPEYTNRVILPVQETIRVEEMRLYKDENSTYIQTITNTPLGSYDVDVNNYRLKVFDRDGDEVDLKHLEEPILRYSINHDGLVRPINATYPWDQEAEALEPGEYTIQVQVPNWQHTADAVGQHTFTVDEDRQEAPLEFLSVVLVMTGFALVMARARRT